MHYLNIISYRLYFRGADHATYQFENLFNGEKILADPILQMANENWEEILNDIKEPIVQAYNLVALQISRAFFNHIPVYEMFLKD